MVDLGDMVADNKWDNPSFGWKLNEYLSLIPRDFGRQRLTPYDILPDLTTVQKETDILDGLMASFAGIVQGPKDDTLQDNAHPEVFNVELKLVDKSSVIDRINRYYEKTKKTMHQTYRYRLKTVYEVDIKTCREAFLKYGKPIGNIMELFHGTKASNLLSIMRQGLIIPPKSSGHCTGRMYGNGVYGSDISSKALNYATGYWGSGGDTSRIFMFLVDFAMGKVHYPSSSGSGFPIRGTDSTFAKAGQSGVYNNEMIVYKTNQVDLKYLLEFN